MTENKLENLEREVNELINLSQQLKEVNDHLSKKNIQLSKENNQLTQNLDLAKEGISKIIKSHKSR
jgi:cell shape-determining protein MreC